MLSVNNKLFDNRNIYNFIDVSINILVTNFQGLTATKEYWLFYYIKNDFLSNWMSLYNANINQDFLGFPLIKIHTRHAIEAFLDLYNLYNDDDYKIVLEYCAKKRKNAGKYKNYLYKNMFTIKSKCEIAKKYDENFERLISTSIDSNNYVHPNVFLDVIPQNDVDKKKSILSSLLNTNLYLLVRSYKLILKKFYNDMQPHLGCCIGGNCMQCYNNAYNVFYYCINNDLLYNINPTPILFQY